jgi:hypothetical protein
MNSFENLAVLVSRDSWSLYSDEFSYCSIIDFYRWLRLNLGRFKHLILIYFCLTTMKECNWIALCIKVKYVCLRTKHMWHARLSTFNGMWSVTNRKGNRKRGN